MNTLRDYQVIAVQKIEAAYQSSRRVLFSLPTGGGKTEIALDRIGAHLCGSKRALIVTDRKVLVQQWVQRIERYGLPRPGILQGENTRAVYAPVLVATAQTIAKRGVPENVGFIVIDETHIWHRTHDLMLEQCRDTAVLGLTATSLRNGLGLRFDTLVVGATIGELIESGYLVRPRCFAPNAEAFKTALDGVEVRGGDYVLGALSVLMRKRALIGNVVETWLSRGESRQTIAFCVDKAHAHELAGEFTLSGIEAAVIVDDTHDDERAALIRRFEAGEVKVLCSVGVLAIGFDSPIASCAILARPTLSTSLHIQQAGRVLRPFPGKRDALILDHASNCLRHMTPDRFIPPSSLSEVDAGTDRRKRREFGDHVTCRNCEAVFHRSLDICPECGHARRMRTVAVVLNGQLSDVTIAHNQPLPDGAIDLGAVHRVYLQMLGYAADKGLRTGWAFYTTCRYFRLDPKNEGALAVSRSWRYEVPLAVEPDVGLWLRNDWKRQVIARQHEKSPSFLAKKSHRTEAFA